MKTSLSDRLNVRFTSYVQSKLNPAMPQQRSIRIKSIATELPHARFIPRTIGTVADLDLGKHDGAAEAGRQPSASSAWAANQTRAR